LLSSRSAGRAFVAFLFLLLVLVAAPVAARRIVTFDGGGWGHGLGMSQYGAYGRALNGHSARSILEHYYSGAHVKRARMPRHVRVGLAQARTSIDLSPARGPSGHGRVIVKVARAGRRLATGRPGDSFTVEPARGGGMRLFVNGRRVRRGGKGIFGSPRRPLVAKYAKFGSLLRIPSKGLSYAYGTLRVGTYPGCGSFCVRVVLAISMQKYLYGLGEVPASWPRAALKAQAIAGRTYGLEKIHRSGQHRDVCDCAVYDSTYDQAYIGDAKRSGSGPYWRDWKGAVDATRRKVLLFRGAPILALYSSSSGGHTEHNENVWGGAPIPFLRGVRDRADAVPANPYHRWSQSMSWRSLSRKLNRAYGTGRLQRLRLVKPFGISGRVTVVGPRGGGARIEGARKTVRVSGYSLRSTLGLRDTLFRISIARTKSASHLGSGLTAGAGETFRFDHLSRPDGLPHAAERSLRAAAGSFSVTSRES
jgi:stage II sporulation protein D